MAGLEKILEDIRLEAQGAADQIIAEAKEQADSVIALAQSEADKLTGAEKARAAEEADRIMKRADSSAALRRQQMILAKKQELIGDVLKKAHRTMADLPDDEYFAAIKNLAARHAQQGSGQLCLSARDLARVPVGFEAELNAALPQGADLRISGETRKIDGGFVLIYEGIEENCSFDAMFGASHEELTDLVQKVLFPGDQKA